jgi:hypothetical protein
MSKAAGLLSHLADATRAGLLSDINAALARQEAEIGDAEGKLKALMEGSDASEGIERRARRLRVRIDVGHVWSLKLRLMKVRLESQLAGQEVDVNSAPAIDRLEQEIEEAMRLLPRRERAALFH